MNTELLKDLLILLIGSTIFVLAMSIYVNWGRKKIPHREMFILELLKHLRSDDLKKTDGICIAFSWTAAALKNEISFEVRHEFWEEYLDLLSESCKELGVYSGCRPYPITDNSNRSYSGEDAYNLNKIRWGNSTMYSCAREAVLICLIEKYETILEELS